MKIGSGSRCSACGRTFTRLGSFVAHRAGRYEQRDEHGKLVSACTRRCLTEPELRRAGFVKAANGVYSRPTEIPAFGVQAHVPQRVHATAPVVTQAIRATVNVRRPQ